MAYDVEDKVVQMRFDNRDFDPNIDASIKSLEKLEAALKFEKAKDGINDLQKSINKFSLSNLTKEFKTEFLDGLTQFETVGRTILYRFTDSAINELNKLKNAFIIAPLSGGWSEYSEQMNSTQVIMSNTGDSLAKITENLDELNEYADRTIYSFGQMTTAIGKFAAAGVELTDATKAIKGLSSAAATVGANNQQLFSAYYNLAQSLQLGYVQLIDWKSLENSTIGNKSMREAFIKTAIEMGKFTEASETAQAAYSDFRGSLQKKWLTTDVVLTTLQKYSRALKLENGVYYDFNESTRQLGAALTEVKDAAGNVTGYISDTYGELSKWEVELGVTAYKSATEIKSFQQMWDTLTEAAGTGWAETWKIIFGDLEKAKDLWTDISNSIESVITAFTNMRNNVLKMWASWGGQEDIVETLKSLGRIFANVGNTIATTIGLLTGTIKDVDGELTDTTKEAGHSLAIVTRRLRLFVTAIERGTDKVKEHAKMLATVLTPLRWIAKVLGFIIKVIASAIVILDALVKTIINIIINIKDFPELIKEIFGNAGWQVLATILQGILAVLKLIYSIGAVVVSVISEIINCIKVFNKETGLGTKLLDGLKTVLYTVVNSLIMFADALGNGLMNLSATIKESKTFKGIFTGIQKVIQGDFVQGILNGFKEGSKYIASGAAGIGNTIISALNGSLEIHSPSRKGAEIGDYFVEGVSDGIVKSLNKVKIASSKIGATAVESTKKGMTTKAFGKRKGIGNTIQNVTSNIKDKLDDIDKQADEIEGATEETEKKTESIFDRIKARIEQLGKDISEFYKNTLKPMIMNLNTGKILAIGFSVAIIAFIFSIGSLIDKVGGMFTSLGKSVAKFTKSIADMADGVASNLKAMAADTRSKAFENIAEGIFTIAKALALLTLVAAWNPEGLKQAAIMLGIFAGSIALIVTAFTMLYNKIQQLQSIGDAKKAVEHFAEMGKTMTRMVSISVMILAITVAMATMTKAIATLSELDTADAFKGLAIVELLIASLVAVVFVLSRFTPQLTRGTLLMFAFSFAIKMFTNALNSIGVDLESGIQRLTNMTVGTYVKLILLIGVLTAASFAISKAQVTISKAIMSLSLLAIAIGIMAFMIGKVKESSEYASKVLSFLASGGALAQIIILMSAFTAMILILCKKQTDIYILVKESGINELLDSLGKLLIKLATSFVIFMGGMALLIGALAISANKLSPTEFNKVIGASIALVAMLGVFIIGLLLILKYFASTSDVARLSTTFAQLSIVLNSLSGTIIGVTASMILIVATMSKFWSKYEGNGAQGVWVLASALITLGALCGIIAGFIAIVGRSLKTDGGKNILKVLIPTIFMIGELLGTIAILTQLSQDREAYISALIGIQAIFAPIIALFWSFTRLQLESHKVSTKGAKASKDFDTTFKMLVAVIAGVAVIVGEIAALSILLGNSGNYVAFGSVMTAYMTVMGGIIAATAVMLRQSSKINSKNSAKSLNSIAIILGTLGALGAALAGSVILISKSGFNANQASLIMAAIGMVLAGAVVGVLNVATRLSSTTINQDKILRIGMLLGFIGVIGAALTGAVVLIGHSGFNAREASLVMAAIGMVLAGAVVGVINTITRISNKTIDRKKILNIGMLLGFIGALGVILAGVTNSLRGITAGTMGAFAALSGIMVAVGGMAVALGKASQIKINKANLGILIAAMGAIASVIPVFAASIAILQNIDTGKIFAIIGALATMSIIFVGMEATFGVLTNFLQKIPVQYIALAIGVLLGISLALLSFSLAIKQLANAPLDKLADGMATLFEVGGKMAAVGAAFVALGVGMIVLGAGALLVSLSLIPFTIALLGAAAAIGLLSASADGFNTFVQAINSLNIQSLVAFAGLLSILAIFSPFVVIISVSLTVLTAAMALFVLGLVGLANSLSTVTAAVVPFVQSLADAGAIISKNAGNFVALGVAIAGLGVALLVASPGLFALAAAIGFVAVSLGAALGLASPFILALGLVLSGLTAIILAFKDTAITLLDALLERLPTIVEALKQLADTTNAMTNVGGALMILGLGFVALGGGALLAGLGILALSGAMKVLQITLNTIFGTEKTMTELFEGLYDSGGKVAAVGAAFLALGIGLMSVGAGSLLAGIGLLALSGALAVLNIVLTNIIGPANNLEEAFLRIWANGGRIAALGAAFVAFGIGLMAVGAGSLLAGVGLLSLAVGLLAVSIPVVIITAAMSIFVLVVTGLVNAITGCINAITMFTMALVILANTGNLLLTGAGLLLVAAGFTAIGAAAMLLAPIIPIILLVVQVMTMVSNILYVVGDAIEYFTSKLETSSVSIGNSMMNIANSFVNAISVIKEGIASIGNIGATATKAAGNVVKGFCGGIISKLPFFKKSTEMAAEATQKGFTDPLEIHSPSEWFAWAGRMCASGFDKSIAGEQPKFFGSGEDAANGVQKGFIEGIKDSFKETKVGKAVSSVVDVISGKKSLGDVTDKIFGKDSPLGGLKDTLAGIWSTDGLNLEQILGGNGSAAENAADGLADYTSALDGAGSSAGATKGTIESLTDTLKNQMKIFERFTADEEMMDPKELINNMESQLRGMQNWANGIDMLAVRGMSGPLLQYLAEMGPEGYKYVEAFLEMTEDEFAQANSLYTQSLEMPSSVASQIGDSYRRAGVEIVESVASGISGGSGAVNSSMNGIHDSITDSTKDTAEEVYNIANTEATATAEDLEKMASQSGEKTGWAYFTALDEWMDSEAANKYIASMQGKIEGKVFSFSNFDMAKAAAQAGLSGYEYISSGWNYRSAENLKKISASSAKFIVDGYTEALTGSQYIAECQKAMYGLAASIIDAGNEKLEINSPSKVTMRQGMYIVEGLAQGIAKYTNLADNASEELGDSTMMTLSDTIRAISSQFTDDMDTTPTIRPVLDLDNVYTGMAELDTMFSTSQARIAGSAYMTTHDDSVERLEDAYRKAIMDGNMELANMLLNSENTNVTVEVHLDANAEGIFDIVKTENKKATERTGASPLMIARRNAINASVLA